MSDHDPIEVTDAWLITLAPADDDPEVLTGEIRTPLTITGNVIDLRGITFAAGQSFAIEWREG